MATASEIKEHMEVLGSDGERVGTVDHVEEDGMIKLTHSDSPDGKHHYISIDLVDHVEEQVHLSVTAEEAVEEWEDEDEDEEVDVSDEPLALGEVDDEEEEEESDEWAEEPRR
jgi:hypothetical protein